MDCDGFTYPRVACLGAMVNVVGVNVSSLRVVSWKTRLEATMGGLDLSKGGRKKKTTETLISRQEALEEK